MKEICFGAVRVFILASAAGVFLLASTFRSDAATGDLDPTFGASGTVITPLTEFSDQPTSIQVQPDGKIIVSGYSWFPNPWEYSDDLVSGFIARYNSSGTLDTSFGTNGIVWPVDDLENSYSILGLKTLLQPDGKIIAIGQNFFSASYQTDFAVWRYNASGTLDASFGTGGKVSTPVGSLHDWATDLVLQPDGKIVVMGLIAENGNGSTYKFGIVRYNPDGSLDNTFGSGGKVITALDTAYGQYSQPNSMLLQPDGKIVIVGTRDASPSYYSILVRYNPDGSLDSGFGSNGLVIHPTLQRCGDSVLQSDGKIVASGGDKIVRFNADGSVDTTFAVNGIYREDVNSIDVVALQPDGRIIGFGSGLLTPPGTLARWGFAATRLNPDGSPDTSFGPNGRRLTSIGTIGKGGLGQAVALQADGKILGAGVTYHSYASNASGDAGIVRYASSSSVSVSGRVTTPDGRGLRNAAVSITDSLGVRRTATTSSFGFYTFDDVRTGDTYVIGVNSRLYRFASRNLVLTESLENVDFAGLE